MPSRTYPLPGPVVRQRPRPQRWCPTSRLLLATLSLLGLVAFATSARADDAPIDAGAGLGTPVRLTKRPPAIVAPPPAAPVLPAAPVPRPDLKPPEPLAPLDHNALEPRPEYVPGHFEARTETICEPAVYADRSVPVYVDRCTPIFDDVRVPVYEDRRVPRVEWVNDLKTSQLKQVVVGMTTVRVKVGETVERRRVGERHDRVRVGSRTERVLVRAEACRVITREDWVPGRYVIVDPYLRGRPNDDRPARGDARR